MAPLPPSCATTSAHNSGNRSRAQRRGHEDKAAGSDTRTTTKFPSPPERSASFHGRLTLASAEQRQMRRPKTQPDLLASVRRSGGAKSPSYKEEVSSWQGNGGVGATERRVPATPSYKEEVSSWQGNGGVGATERRVPAKVLVNVSVQNSLLGPLQVMASSEWTVAELVAAAVRLYVKEGRRPQLLTAEPSSFSLHYSQFSLESLDPKEKLIGLGSRNFFLCYNKSGDGAATASTSSADVSGASTSSTASSCSKQAEKGSKMAIPWLRFIDSLL